MVTEKPERHRSANFLVVAHSVRGWALLRSRYQEWGR